jgi:hypothetical protein
MGAGRIFARRDPLGQRRDRRLHETTLEFASWIWNPFQLTEIASDFFLQYTISRRRDSRFLATMDVFRDR